ncbi:acyl-CoA N-acyltransferase [Trematosphaeria pertusa]|uniref:Acyl-CoA N-acyltransferase n=1 Tax=Trematosphaeria pertusa TaxID=390896 RepID=A0A6A6IQG8_9PLEO|nr:acyl-CoA N-acyltransferase [Trematosphaeria pertusa]KAF2252298.1 acyl-CoA N-acyltransferase [Trematosphaeria pertusa]
MYVRPVTRDDIPAIAAIGNRSFQNDELHVWLYPHRHTYPDDLRRYQVLRIRSRAVGIRQLGFVVVTEEGDANWSGAEEVVGFAYYYRYGDDEGAQKWINDSWFKKIERYLLDWELWYESKFLDRASDPERVKQYIAAAPWDRLKPLDPRWHLSVLGVSPQHQRRGVGGMLVKHGQEIAEKEGLPFTLESSVVGRKLYLKMGFKIVEECEIFDVLDFVAMVWEPEESKGKWLEDIGEETANVRAAK